MDEEFVDAGIVRSVNPARRELRVDGPKRVVASLEAHGWLHIVEASGEILRCKIVKATPHNGLAIVTVAPGVARDTVAQLKGCRVVVPASARMDRAAFDITAEECVGMTIVSKNDFLIGEVVVGFETKANGVLEVLRPDGGSLLLPFVPELIEKIDWVGKKVHVGDIEPFAVESDSGPRLIT